MLSPIQIVLIGAALLGAIRTIRQFRAGLVPPVWLVFWLVFWVGVSIVSLVPQLTDKLANLVGVGRGADVAVYISIVSLFALCFMLLMKIEDLERDLTRLVRTLALREDQDTHDHT